MSWWDPVGSHLGPQKGIGGVPGIPSLVLTLLPSSRKILVSLRGGLPRLRKGRDGSM